MFINVFEFYKFVESVIEKLHQAGETSWETILRDAMASGSTSGEILGNLNVQFKQFQQTRTVKALHLEADVRQVLDYLNEVLGRREHLLHWRLSQARTLLAHGLRAAPSKEGRPASMGGEPNMNISGIFRPIRSYFLSANLIDVIFLPVLVGIAIEGLAVAIWGQWQPGTLLQRLCESFGFFCMSLAGLPQIVRRESISRLGDHYYGIMAIITGVITSVFFLVIAAVVLIGRKP